MKIFKALPVPKPHNSHQQQHPLKLNPWPQPWACHHLCAVHHDPSNSKHCYPSPWHAMDFLSKNSIMGSGIWELLRKQETVPEPLKDCKRALFLYGLVLYKCMCVCVCVGAYGKSWKELDFLWGIMEFSKILRWKKFWRGRHWCWHGRLRAILLFFLSFYLESGRT